MYLVIKRTIDIVLSLLAILLLSPVLVVSSIVLLFTGEHLIIYRQPRVGRNYREFNIYKFVTMRADSPKYGTITLKNDPRVLPVGKVLRKTKVNELPQLFNILWGHMSIVGPRPLVASEVAMYDDDVKDVVYADNKPGLTGMGSLFFRDEDELIAATGEDPETAYREHIMPIKGALEAWYRNHKSFRVDVKIVILTAWAVISPGSAPIVKAFLRERGIPRSAISAYQALSSSTL